MSLDWNNSNKVLMMFNEDIHFGRNDPQKKTSDLIGGLCETDKVNKTMLDIFSIVSDFAYFNNYDF